VHAADGPDAKLAALRGQYEGETAYVFGCGPSIGDVWSDGLATFLEDKLVIAMKQSFLLMPSVVDFHIFNRCRNQDYDYPTPPPIRIAVELEAFTHQGDIRLPFWHHPDQKWLHSVLFSRAFDRWDLARGSTRGWGPGLMLELGIFLPVHLGCRRVVFFGWDMSPLDPSHFHPADVNEVQIEEHVVVSTALPQVVPALTGWYASRGLEAYLCSPRTTIPLPRLSVEEVIRLR
jgi:hypothetical protein